MFIYLFEIFINKFYFSLFINLLFVYLLIFYIFYLFSLNWFFSVIPIYSYIYLITSPNNFVLCLIQSISLFIDMH